MFKDYKEIIETIEYLYRKTTKEYSSYIELRIDTKALFELLLDLKDYVLDYLSIDSVTFFRNFGDQYCFNMYASIPNKYKHKELGDSRQKIYNPHEVKHQDNTIYLTSAKAQIAALTPNITNQVEHVKESSDSNLSVIESSKIEKYEGDANVENLIEVLTNIQIIPISESPNSKTLYRISFQFSNENYKNQHDSRSLAKDFINTWNQYLSSNNMQTINI